MKKWALLPAVLTALILVACKPQSGKPEAAAPEPQRVEVASAGKRSVQDTLELDGTVAPRQQVNLVARVPGTLTSANFKDGEYVHKGQLLFVVEQPPYVEQLKLAQARLDQSRSDYDRQTQLLAENATSKASVENSKANLQQAQANVNLARINLGYTEIRAPFDGVIGRRAVDPGNFVGATPGGTVLATLMQISPAFVNAAVGERQAIRIRALAGARGANPQHFVGRTRVGAELQGESKPSELGVLDFIDHQAGSASGTIALRGLFDNAARRLVPGFYARLVIDMGGTREALVLPRSVVQADQQGSYVFVVGTDSVARRRTVTTAPLGGEDLEVLSGVQAGDRVVVAGYAKVMDGQTVSVAATTAPAAAPTAPAAGAPKSGAAQ